MGFCGAQTGGLETAEDLSLFCRAFLALNGRLSVMGSNGQYDDRLPRQECRSIRRTMRRMQGIVPRILSAVLLDSNEVEVTTGDEYCVEHWKLRRSEVGWEVAECLGGEVRISKNV
jgi:hypothetical protein